MILRSVLAEIFKRIKSESMPLLRTKKRYRGRWTLSDPEVTTVQSGAAGLSEGSWCSNCPVLPYRRLELLHSRPRGQSVIPGAQVIGYKGTITEWFKLVCSKYAR